MTSKSETRRLSDKEGDLSSHPVLISLDQTYVCFDVEQPCDAKQELLITRSPTVPNNVLVAFRIRTNAPTRYIVNPNSGLLSKDKPFQNVVIELVGNRFNPHHRLIVQAIQVQSEAEMKQVWKSARLQKELQIVPLELSTTLMNIENTNNMDSGNTQETASLSSVLEQSSRTGEERVKELIGLNAMLKDDIEKINNNIITAQKLKEILLKHLEQRKKLSENLKIKLKTKEEEYVKLVKKVESQENILKHLQTPKPTDNNNCVIS
uniref:Major sperm protein n=1 Tax=Bursaphelenchus xylophilus TaxID=6326 RepID=A0A1I7SWD6_BURXY